jgi:hypothetical protein
MILLSLILAHLIADFYLQTDKMVNDKYKYLKLHMFHHFVSLLIPFSIIWYQQDYANFVYYIFTPMIVILSSHFLIDYIKIKLIDKNNSGKLVFFITDQFLHIAILIITYCTLFRIDFRLLITKFIDIFTSNGNTLNTTTTILFITMVLILTTTVSGHVIRILLGTIPNQLATFEGNYLFKNEKREDLRKGNVVHQNGVVEEYSYTIINKHDLSRGKLIGYIERLLVVILTFFGAFPAIAFIITAKSITRFKQMDDRNWAEYFLLGTLTSMLLGITAGLILRQVLT